MFLLFSVSPSRRLVMSQRPPSSLEIQTPVVVVVVAAAVAVVDLFVDLFVVAVAVVVGGGVGGVVAAAAAVVVAIAVAVVDLFVVAVVVRVQPALVQCKEKLRGLQRATLLFESWHMSPDTTNLAATASI